MKVYAPGPANWRGQQIVPDETGAADIPPEAFEELRSHGFRPWTEDDAAKPAKAKPAKAKAETATEK